MGSGGSNGGAGGLFELAVMCKYVQGVLMLWIEEVFALETDHPRKNAFNVRKIQEPARSSCMPIRVIAMQYSQAK